MLLSAYLTATQRLLENPVPATPLYATSDLTAYINEGRQQLAGDAECIRATGTANLTTGQNIYPFSLFASFVGGFASGNITFAGNPSPGDTITLNGVAWTFVANGAIGNQTNIGGTIGFTLATLSVQLNASVNASLVVASYNWETVPANELLISYKTSGPAGNTYTLAASIATPSGATLTGGNLAGIQGALTIRQLAVASGGGYKLLTSRPWPWFNRYGLAKNAAVSTGVPAMWSQQGRGTSGTFGVDPTPASGLALQADCVLLPINLATDGDPEALPYPFTDAIPYYAAYKAYLSSQKTQDATTMLGRYEQFVRRAIQESTPTVLPGNYQGGMGAQLAGVKQPLTQAPQPPQGAQ